MKLNAYMCIAEEDDPGWWWGEPPEPGRDCAIVAAETRSKAKYIFWKEYGNKAGYTLTEYLFTIQKTGEIERDAPGILTTLEDGPFWR